MAPVLDFDKDASMDVPYHFKDKPSLTPKVTVDPTFNPFETEKKSSALSRKPVTENWNSLYVNVENDALAIEKHRG